MAEFDAEKQMAAMYKVLAAREESQKKLQEKIDKQLVSYEAVMAKVTLLEKVVNLQKSRPEVADQVFLRSNQVDEMKKELVSTEIRLKQALARIEALSTHIAALAKDHVARADLVALEKKLTEAIKKAK